MWLAVISEADTLIQVGVEAFEPKAWWCTKTGAAAADLLVQKWKYSRQYEETQEWNDLN